MLPSGNDAAQAICDNLGSICHRRTKFSSPETFRKYINKKQYEFGKLFIEEMNNISFDLGLTCTSFANPHGLMC